MRKEKSAIVTHYAEVDLPHKFEPNYSYAEGKVSIPTRGLKKYIIVYKFIGTKIVAFINYN